MDRIKQVIAKRLKGRDCRQFNEFNKYGWAMVTAYGKVRNILQVKYHFEKYSMYIDDIIYETLN